MNSYLKICLILSLFFNVNYLFAQTKDSTKNSNTPIRIFNGTRVINGHSTDMLLKNQLECRFTQRFGDMSTSGASTTGFGLDNITDIRLAVEYGLMNNLNFGIGRSKGAGPFTQIIDGYIKYNLLQQNLSGSHPLSISILQTMAGTYMKESTDSTLPSSFGGQNVRRLAYCTQLLIGKQFGKRVGILISPTYVHRNYVAYDDRNALFSCGLSLRFKICKSFSVLAESFLSNRYTYSVLGAYNRIPLGLGFELKSGKTLFLVNITNSTGIGETQFIPYTSSNIKNGEYRMGFTIAHSLIFKKK